MIRYNFDKVPSMASGFGVHAETIKQAWSMAYRLAKSHGWAGKLQFRNNSPCPANPDGRNRGYECRICHPSKNKKPFLAGY